MFSGPATVEEWAREYINPGALTSSDPDLEHRDPGMLLRLIGMPIVGAGRNLQCRRYTCGICRNGGSLGQSCRDCEPALNRLETELGGMTIGAYVCNVL